MANINQKTSSDGDHFYTREGVPAYGAGIKEVRERGYLPSPSTILKVLNKEGILQWYARIVAETAVDNTIDLTGRSRDWVVNQVLDMARTKSREPLERGTMIHSIAEEILMGRNPIEGNPYSVAVSDYHTRNIIRTRELEFSVKHIAPDICFAGRVDALVEHQAVGLALIDWKSSAVKRSKTGNPTPRFYDQYIMQLAAYSKAIPGSPQPISVAIDTTEGHEGDTYEKIWSDIEWARGWRMFYLAYRLWCEDRKYSPHEYKG